MTKELAKEIVEILKSTKSLVTEQMPDVVSQYIVAQSSIASMYIWIFGTISVILLIAFIIYIGLKISDNDTEMLVPTILLFSLIFSIPFITCLYNIQTNIMIKTAPKAFILEWLSNFYK